MDYEGLVRIGKGKEGESKVSSSILISQTVSDTSGEPTQHLCLMVSLAFLDRLTVSFWKSPFAKATQPCLT